MKQLTSHRLLKGLTVFLLVVDLLAVIFYFQALRITEQSDDHFTYYNNRWHYSMEFSQSWRGFFDGEVAPSYSEKLVGLLGCTDYVLVDNDNVTSNIFSICVWNRAIRQNDFEGPIDLLGEGDRCYYVASYSQDPPDELAPQAMIVDEIVNTFRLNEDGC